MKLIQRDYKKKRRGMVLILALVISSIILLFGLDIANISAKQLYLSSFNKNSESALFMADAMFECTYYWDTYVNLVNGTTGKGSDGNYYFPPPGGSPTAGSPDLLCMGVNIVPSSADPTQYATSQQTINGVVSQVTKLQIAPSGLTQPCASATITKTSTGTTIDVYGQNTCDTTQPRRVERGFRIEY